jgi:hypothetical protein
MAESSLKHLQLFRGKTQYKSLADAKEALGGVTLQAGEPAVAFYGAEGKPVQAVLAVGGSGNTKDYFYDYAEIKAKIDALDGADITYTNGGSDAYVSAATTVDAAIKALDAGLKTAKGEQKQYKLEKDTSTLPTNVKERYNLKVSTNGTQWDNASGSTPIDIYKDSALQKVELVTEEGKEYLKFTYLNVDGEPQVVKIDVSKFLSEAEFKDGFELSDTEGASGHTVSVKLDTTPNSDSAKFLHIKTIDGENGAIALSGITEAIAAASAFTKSEVIGASGDDADDDTINGAKAFASGVKTELIGTDTDASTANTIHGAKNYTDAAKTQLIGASTDATTADTIYGAKNYADAAVAAKNVSASGETGDNALISASADTNNVTITSTQKLKDAVAAAETAVQSVTASNQTGNYVVVSADKAAKTNVVTISTDETKLSNEFTAIGKALTALSGTTADTANSTSIVGAKLYTDQKITDLAVSAEGDTYVSATVGSGADNKKVTVSATTKTQGAITAAENSLQNLSCDDNTIHIGEKAGNVNTKSLPISLNISADNSWLSKANDGLKVADTLDCGTF